LESTGFLHEHEAGEHSHKGKWDIFPCCPGARIDRIEKEFKDAQELYIAAKHHYRSHHDESIKGKKEDIMKPDDEVIAGS